MAALTSGNRSLPDDIDYSKSHRAVPSVDYNTTRAQRAPSFGAEPGKPRRDLVQQQAGASVEGGHTRRRGNSFSSLLHRTTSSSSSSHGKNSGSLTAPADAPPLPATRIAQAQVEAANSRNIHTQQTQPEAAYRVDGPGFDYGYGYHSSVTGGYEQEYTTPHDFPNNSISHHVIGENGNKMLRKSSKARQAEQERLEAMARAAPRQPPRLPSINDFQADQRPDSFQIFTNQYNTTFAPAVQHATTANFSRPGQIYNMPSSTNNSSSSPAYALRTGNAFAQQASGSPPSAGNVAVGQKMTSNGEYVNTSGGGGSLDRGESMAHRGRYSYASDMAPVNAVNSPRRVRRRKDPTPFNILVVGARNSGKTSFISFLRHSLALPANRQQYSASTTAAAQVNASKSSFTSHYLETELDGERVGLTLWDSAGLEKHLIDLQLRETAAFVESKFEETFLEEQKVNRSPGAKDTHIHCVFFLLEPNKLDNNIVAARNGKPGTSAAEVLEVLDDEMDLQVIRALWGKTTVIPVISKADTLTASHMAFLKKSIWKALKASNLDPIEALELEEDDEGEEEDEYDDEANALPARRKNGNLHSLDEETTSDSSDSIDDNDTPLPSKAHSHRNSHNRASSLATDHTANNDSETPYIPMSFLSPDLYDLPPYTPFPKTTAKGQIGRRFPWGFADPYDPEHCDFVRLKESVFGEWRLELRDLSRTKWYENWRTSRLRDLPGKRVRARGGVTPTAAVPREGRMSGRLVSSGGGAGEAVPRSVSGGVGVGVGSGVSGGGYGLADGGFGPEAGQQQQGGQRGGLSKAERMMGIGAGEGQTLSSRGVGTYRGVESYQ
ncbi:hypothetical protein LTR78_005851 [Recurvomyces mirabilis]|uniref:Septin-type G domain-containing protein n=1 Tax=Recurvomyces mirabilis TaxID=574656 RepID=A0AAE1C168_9PEZI|nr:hypothetical protein LTR78_005851 [Recurvomyces mirabilis]KAK5154232.1 hypothetical protein LTS14_006917 [Recurvomyces mirabilis]